MPLSYEEMVELHDAKQMHLHQNFYEFGEWLALLQKQQPRIYLEIGAYRLGSAEMAIEALPSLELLITVDVNDLYDDPVLAGKLSDHRDRIAFVHGDSTTVETFAAIREMLGDRTVDALFIDGCHLFNSVIRDYAFYSRLVTPRTGLIGFHDVNLKNLPNNPPQVHLGSKLFWEALQACYSNQCQLIETDPGPWGNYGIGVYRVLHEGNR